MSFFVRQIVAILLFIGCLVLFSASMDNRPFHTRGEAREGMVVSAMLRERNFILPLRAGESIPSKPPMFHWIAALTAESRGALDEFSIRFPSALAGAGTIAIAFSFFVGRAGMLVGGLSVLLLATSFEFARSATHARVDMCFTFFLTLLFVGMFRLLDPARKAALPRSLELLGISLGVAGAVLTKGPAGLLYPVVVGGLYLGLTRIVVSDSEPSFGQRLIEIWSSPRLRRAALACVVGLALAAIWYAAAFWQNGPAFMYKQIFQENINRIFEVDDSSPGHRKSFLFVFVVLFLGFLPWSLLAPIPLRSAFQFFKKPRALREALRSDQLALIYSTLWIGVLFAVICLSRSKRSVYFLPAFPAMAYLVASASIAQAKELFSFRVARIFSVIVLLLVVLIALVMGLGASPRLSSSAIELLVKKTSAQVDAGNVLAQLNGSLWPWVAMLSAFIITWFVVARPGLSLGRMLIANAVAILIVIFSAIEFVLPAVAQRAGAQEFMREVVAELPPGATLYEFDDNFYAAAFYLELLRHQPIGHWEELPELAPGVEEYLLIRESDIERLQLDRSLIEVLRTSSTDAANGRGRLLFAKLKAAAADSEQPSITATDQGRSTQEHSSQ